jgi:hypothetical protein
LRKYVFPFGSCLPSWPPPSRLSVKWAPTIGFVFSPVLPDLSRVVADFHHAAAPHAARSAPRMSPSHYSPPSLPPSDHALTHRNEPNNSAIEAPPSPAVTHRHLHPEQPRPPIKGEHHRRVSPHPSPPLFSSLHA